MARGRRPRFAEVAGQVVAASHEPTGQPDVAELAARVDRLEAAVASAGAALGEAGVPTARPAAPARGTPTTPLRKGARSLVQIGLAAVPGVIYTSVAGQPGWVTAVVALVLTPVVTFVQNELEDRETIPALWREPSRHPRRG